MSLSTYLKRLEYVDYLIKKRSTGNLKTLAKKLNISKSQTTNFLREMRELGFPVAYSRKLCPYYYTEDDQMVKRLYEKEEFSEETALSEKYLKKISGGKGILNYSIQTNYISMSKFNFVQ